MWQKTRFRDCVLSIDLLASCGVYPLRPTPRQHLFHAALFWSAIGLFLGGLGLKFVLAQHEAKSYLWLGLSLTIGILKGELALKRGAKKIISRLKSFPAQSSLLMVFTRGQWLLIFFMMVLGFLVRHLGIAPFWRGVVLSAVGVALLWGSFSLWRAIFRSNA